MPVTVTQYTRLATDAAGHTVQVGAAPGLGSFELTNGASAVNSSPFPDTVRFIRVATDAKIRVAIGVGATATSTSPLMHANSTEFFSVIPGDRISVINSA